MGQVHNSRDNTSEARPQVTRDECPAYTVSPSFVILLKKLLDEFIILAYDFQAQKHSH